MLQFLASTALVLSSLVGPHGPQTATEQRAADTLTISAPIAVVTFSTGNIKGEPRRLSWSPDGKTIYLQSVKKTGTLEEIRHFYVSVDQRDRRNAPGEPQWAQEYWKRKAARTAPSDPKVEIDIVEKKEHIQGGPAVLAGAMSGAALSGQTSPSNPTPDPQEISDRGFHGEDITTYRLTLKGELVGSGVRGEFFPGKTFGWSPASIGAIAFSDDKGHLAVMDLAKRKQIVPNTLGVLLPAWSDDGRRIAFLQKTGKKQFTAYVVEIQ